MTEGSINFDRAVPFYDKTRGMPPGIDAQSAALIARAAELTSDNRVLEIGIGTGRIALPLSTHVGAVFGADISAGMMGLLLEKRTSEPVYPVQADAHTLPYRTGSLDAVVVVHVFHLVADVEGVIRELGRVLKPDGVIIQCWDTNDNTFGPLRQSWKQAIGKDRDQQWQQATTILDTLGWHKRGDTHELAYTTQQAPAHFVERFRQRIWSATWRLTDDEHARGLAAMQSFAAGHFDDINAPIDVEHVFHVSVYAPPSVNG